MRTLLILGYLLGTTLAIPITKDDRIENRGVKTSNRMEEFRHLQDPYDTHLIRTGSNRYQQFHREEISQANSEGFYLQFFVTRGKQPVTNPRASIYIYSNTTSHNKDKFRGKPPSHKLQKNKTNKRKGVKTFESDWFKTITCDKMDDGHLGKACKKIMLNKRSIGYQTTQDNTYPSSDETGDANSQNTRNVNNPFDSSEFTDSNDLEDIPYDYYTTDAHSNAHSSEFSAPSDSNESNLPSGSKQDDEHSTLNRSGISSSISVSSESRESRESGSNSGSKEVLAKPGKNSNELSAANDSSEQDVLNSISTTSTTNWNVPASSNDSDSSDDITDTRSSSVSRRVSYSKESSSLIQSNETDASSDFTDYQNLAEMSDHHLEETVPSVN